jgi:hypothetical protein
MKFIVVIPSYKRSDSINKKTLKVLKKYNFPNNRTYIFVANQEEKELYEKQLDNNDTNDKYNIIIGKLGLANQRNFIRNYFPEKTNILSMDDDVEEINYLVDSRYEDIQDITEKRIIKSKRKKKDSRRESPSKRKNYVIKNIPNFETMVEKAFNLAIKKNINLWGVYPINNPYFMSNKISTDLKLITGPFFGYINQHHKNLENTINEKEDVERTIQYYIQDGAVLRLNNFVVKTSYYRNQGGMQFEGKNRKEEALKSSLYLAKKYPELTTLDTSKKSGYAEVRLKDKKHFLEKSVAKCFLEKSIGKNHFSVASGTGML